ncbi:hypothetical protein [Paractinoplanes lichenicola]|uniref:Uncharacterized protein n=1 Tax=Paractinoplanes lichenicola TaxID=2802976 RepID=A0ABS1VXI2_9ACTN|nr:hypothetical protein [Actinoplanes lichenicola]MBL7259205.1 hypothetical protein [Actinoplanes lichenicola]
MRRPLLILAVLLGALTYMMVLVGLSFALIVKGSDLWAVVPLAGAVIAVAAMFTIRRLPEPAPAPDPRQPAEPLGTPETGIRE